MALDANKETFEEIELFGKPALYSGSRIDRKTVPENLYCYDLRGSDYDFGEPATVEAHVTVNHVGTVITAEKQIIPDGKDHLPLEEDGLEFLGEDMSLKELCEKHGIEYLHSINALPAEEKDAKLFYALTKEADEELGTIGHLRMDFGRSGKEFWTTWHPRGEERLNSAAFKSELDRVVNTLRRDVLKDLNGMEKYCHEHGGEISGGYRQNYGYVIDMDERRYLLRCSPAQGAYSGYLTCFDLNEQRMNMEKRLVGRISFANGETMEFTDKQLFVDALREELPYVSTSELRYEVLTDDAETRKAVDDELYDLFGENNPCELEHYENTPKQDITMGGM